MNELALQYLKKKQQEWSTEAPIGPELDRRLMDIAVHAHRLVAMAMRCAESEELKASGDTDQHKVCLRCKRRITCEAGHCDDCGATDCVVTLPLWAVQMLETEEQQRADNERIARETTAASDKAIDEALDEWVDLTLESMRDLERAYRTLCEQTGHDHTKEAWDVFIDKLTGLAPDLIALGLSHAEAAERLRERVKGLTHGHVALDGLKRMLGYPDSAIVTGSTLGEPDVAFEELTIYHDGSATGQTSESKREALSAMYRDLYERHGAWQVWARGLVETPCADDEELMHALESKIVKNFEYGERVQLVVVEAPGDRCGGSRVLPDGTPCPGCRACC